MVYKKAQNTGKSPKNDCATSLRNLQDVLEHPVCIFPNQGRLDSSSKALPSILGPGSQLLLNPQELVVLGKSLRSVTLLSLE